MRIKFDSPDMDWSSPAWGDWAPFAQWPQEKGEYIPVLEVVRRLCEGTLGRGEEDGTP